MPKLSQTARELIGDGRNTVYWSAASSWEVSIKYALDGGEGTSTLVLDEGGGTM